MELPLLRKLSLVQLLSLPAQGTDAASARPPKGLLKPTGSLISSFCGIEPSLLPAKLLLFLLVMLGLFLLASLLLILKLLLDELLPGLQLLFLPAAGGGGAALAACGATLATAGVATVTGLGGAGATAVLLA
jgi:hypothetical protein